MVNGPKGAPLRQHWGGTTGRTPDKQFFGRIWPNGNFSLGTGPVGSEALEFSEASGDNLAAMPDLAGLQAAVAALTSSNAIKSHTDRTCARFRGLKGITPMGQQMLRSACYLMERDYGNSDLCFGTLTVPKLPPGARYLLAVNWSELVRQLIQWVCRKLQAAGRPKVIAGCTEIQSARLQNSGEAYLHLHVVFPSHSNVAGRLWAVEWRELRDWWGNALKRFSCCELPHHPRVEVAPVKKSAERYMGKYLSKGSGEALEAFVDDLGESGVPPSWWFMSAEMRRRVKAETSRGPNTGTVLNDFIRTALDGSDMTCFEWIKPVMMTFTDRPVHIGWCGRLRPDIRDDLLGMLAVLR